MLLVAKQMFLSFGADITDWKMAAILAAPAIIEADWVSGVFQRQAIKWYFTFTG